MILKKKLLKGSCTEWFDCQFLFNKNFSKLKNKQEGLTNPKGRHSQWVKNLLDKKFWFYENSQIYNSNPFMQIFAENDSLY